MILVAETLDDGDLIASTRESGVRHIVVLSDQFPQQLGSLTSFGVTFQHAPQGILTPEGLAVLVDISIRRPHTLLVGPSEQCYQLLERLRQ